MGRLAVRVEAYGVVLTPHELRPAQLVVYAHPLVRVEAERGHVQCGVSPVGVARVERADHEYGVAGRSVAFGPTQHGVVVDVVEAQVTQPVQGWVGPPDVVELGDEG